MNTGSGEIALCPWSEVVRRIEEVGDDFVTLTFVTKHRLSLPQSEISRWKEKLLVGSRVAIVMLDDGSTRVRSLEEDGGEDQG